MINEFMASNGSTLLDEDGDSPDWIEIFNPDESAVELEGSTPFLPHPIRSKGGFKALPPKAIS